MAKLKLSPLLDDKPVKMTIELPATVHRDLTEYAEALALQSGVAIQDASRLIAPIIQRFIATDREFARTRRARPSRSA